MDRQPPPLNRREDLPTWVQNKQRSTKDHLPQLRLLWAVNVFELNSLNISIIVQVYEYETESGPAKNQGFPCCCCFCPEKKNKGDEKHLPSVRPAPEQQ